MAAGIAQRAEAEAERKGLTGEAKRAYIGGVWHHVKQAHARATAPGKGAAHLNRKRRVEKREAPSEYTLNEYRAAMARHDYAAAVRWGKHIGPDAVKSAQHHLDDAESRVKMPKLHPDELQYFPTLKDERTDDLLRTVDALERNIAKGVADRRNGVQSVQAQDLDRYRTYLRRTIAEVRKRGNSVSRHRL